MFLIPCLRDLIPHNADCLQEIDLTTEFVFIEHNFAPSRLRRNIDILGILHKRILGLNHPIIQRFLPVHVDFSILCGPWTMTINLF